MGYVSIWMGDRLSALILSLMALRLTAVVVVVLFWYTLCLNYMAHAI